MKPGFEATTVFDGTIFVRHSYFVMPEENQLDIQNLKDIKLAKMIFILFHELSHLKNLKKYKAGKPFGKRTPEKFLKEAGQYIEE